jgi:hypothetical protein
MKARSCPLNARQEVRVRSRDHGNSDYLARLVGRKLTGQRFSSSHHLVFTKIVLLFREGVTVRVAPTLSAARCQESVPGQDMEFFVTLTRAAPDAAKD